MVEDEPDIRRFLRSSLARRGLSRGRVAERRGAARIDAGTHKPDLAIVDLGLPDLDGIEVIRRIREWSPMPIVVLSARVQERSKIEALDAGADDYITKPFGVGELLARVRVGAAPRGAAGTAKTLSSAKSTIDLEKRARDTRRRRVHLTPIEFRLLACLAKHLGMVVTHRQLLTEVWGPTHATDTHYLRVYMKQLRDKLEADPVQPQHLLTETGVGYRLVDGTLDLHPRAELDHAVGRDVEVVGDVAGVARHGGEQRSRQSAMPTPPARARSSRATGRTRSPSGSNSRPSAPHSSSARVTSGRFMKP